MQHILPRERSSAALSHPWPCALAREALVKNLLLQ